MWWYFYIRYTLANIGHLLHKLRPVPFVFSSTVNDVTLDGESGAYKNRQFGVKWLMDIAIMWKRETMPPKAYGCVEIIGGMDFFLTKDIAKDLFMLPQTQNLMFVFKMIHCNGKK